MSRKCPVLSRGWNGGERFGRMWVWGNHPWVLFFYCVKKRIEAVGMENINVDKQYIFCPNHESYVPLQYTVQNKNGKEKRKE